MEKIGKLLKYVDDHNLYPDLRIIQGSATPEVVIDGKKVLMFSSNNYLSLSIHPKVIQAAVDATKKYGTGSGGSRLLSGNLEIHRELEEKIAEFKGGEDAIVLPSGYSTNIGVISAIMNVMKVSGISLLSSKGIVISDQLNHASIIDACKLAGQKTEVYKHLDLKDLEKKLKKYKRKRKLIITDGVFSMNGDIAPLDKISILAKKYNAITMVDEAHSTGMLGKNGRGTLEYFNLKPTKDIDIVMGTLSKALGSSGGFVVGSKRLIKYLRIASRSYMFSTAITPASSATVTEALKVIQDEPEWREKLWSNSCYIREKFQQMGYDTLGSQTQIIPIMIGTDENAIKFSRLLFENNTFAPCVRWPAVEKNKARIRFTVMATHTKEQMDNLLSICKKIGQSLKVI